MIRTCAVVSAFAVVILSGFVHGLWTDRWRVAPEISEAAARLPRLPWTLGDWRGSDLQLAPTAPGRGWGRGPGSPAVRELSDRDRRQRGGGVRPARPHRRAHARRLLRRRGLPPRRDSGHAEDQRRVHGPGGTVSRRPLRQTA